MTRSSIAGSTRNRRRSKVAKPSASTRGPRRKRSSLAEMREQLDRRTDELKEARERQAATAEILKVINASPGDLAPVFDIVLEKAHNLCDVPCGSLQLFHEGYTRAVAVRGMNELFEKFLRNGYRLDSSQPVQSVRPFQIDDLAKFIAGATHGSGPRIAFELGGLRTLLSVPLVRDGVAFGRIVAGRQEVRPFSEHQIAVLQSFADQAVIAIENARLFNQVQIKTRDLEDSLQQQIATADVLKLISRSAFDLHTVLQTLVASAARLCDADMAQITRQRDGVLFRAEAYGFPDDFIEFSSTVPVVADRGSAIGRALLEGTASHIPDVLVDRDYTFNEARRIAQFRAVLAVPMLRDGTPIGVIVMTRKEPRPFTTKQIELATTFADQAAIAIGNVQLFDEVQARTHELAKSLDDLRAAQDRLVQTEKLASLGQLTAGIAHEIKNPLNFVNNFSALSVELTDELNDILKQAELDAKTRQEVGELMQILKSNIEKVVQHGKRADSIVKNMLLHSREARGERRTVDINALVEESLNLAYHGARAERSDFQITLERDLDPGAGQIELSPQEITRVLLNMISNGFYAATRRANESGNGFEPMLLAATRGVGDRVEIRIRDNGTGIPPEVQQKIFNPFFTTKPAGEGTGLGLSISHDIVVKQHGGTIDVETEPGHFTEFIITLPRALST